MGYRCGECATKGLMCACVSSGVFDNEEWLGLYLLVVSKYLCCEMQVIIFRLIVLFFYMI